MVLTMTLGSKNRSNIMETRIVNLTIGIPIITIKEVSHGTDTHTLGSKNRSNIMETIIINLTIGIPIITITEVFHGTDKNMLW